LVNELDLRGMEVALTKLGERCPVGSEIVIIGGAAAVLSRWLNRATADIDVIAAEPRLAELGKAIRAVAEELGLPDGWMNDGAKGYARALPPDFRERLVDLGQFGRLRVRSIGRKDFIVLKVYGMRGVDIEDLENLRATAEEMAFVRAQVPRIAEFDPKQAHHMELFLDQDETSLKL
jgi:predicted nucleotidyltransferase